MLNKNMGLVMTGLLVCSLVFFSCPMGPDAPEPQRSWTIMMYMDADNNLEEALLGDIQQVMSGLRDTSINVVTLFDRVPGYSTDNSTLGSNFTDTRLFKFMPGEAVPLHGGDYFQGMTRDEGVELNMGNAQTLKDFIDYCKYYFPAEKYALVLSNHGGGVRSRDISASMEFNTDSARAICYDDTNGSDALFTAEITDVLTSAESVDLLVLDACVMGTIEVAYQYRPDTGDFSADYMVASAPNVWGYGFDYQAVLARISDGGSGTNGQTADITGGSEARYDSAALSALNFGGLFVEEQHDSAEAVSETSQVLALYDLSQAAAVQTAFNGLSVELAANDIDGSNFYAVVYGTVTAITAKNYFNETDPEEWYMCPHVDLYDTAEKLNNSGTTAVAVQTAAAAVQTAIDDMVVYSYAGSDYPSFTNGLHGLAFFCTYGELQVDWDGVAGMEDLFQWQWWYNAIQIYSSSFVPLGNLASCKAGATAGNGIVQNWFELLDMWYDNGNSNSYNY